MPDLLPILPSAARRSRLARGDRGALLRAVNVAGNAGVAAILVHALSDAAKQFYLSSGFVESPLQPMTLLMTLETVRAVLAEGGVRSVGKPRDEGWRWATRARFLRGEPERDVRTARQVIRWSA